MLKVQDFLLDFLETNNHSPNASAGAKLLLQWLLYLGVNRVAYFNINKDSSAVFLHFDPEWLDSYVKGKYYISDPHMVHPDNMDEGFSIIMKNIF